MKAIFLLIHLLVSTVASRASTVEPSQFDEWILGESVHDVLKQLSPDATMLTAFPVFHAEVYRFNYRFFLVAGFNGDSIESARFLLLEEYQSLEQYLEIFRDIEQNLRSRHFDQTSEILILEGVNLSQVAIGDSRERNQIVRFFERDNLTLRLDLTFRQLHGQEPTGTEASLTIVPYLKSSD